MGIESLTEQECLRLLAQRSVGRVAFTERALPTIRPVSYALVGRHIVLRTREAGLAARLDGQVVAFGVDDVDPEAETGWSVVVTGSARLLSGPGEPARLLSLARTASAVAVWITPSEMQGRRIGRWASGAA